MVFSALIKTNYNNMQEKLLISISTIHSIKGFSLQDACSTFFIPYMHTADNNDNYVYIR